MPYYVAVKGDDISNRLPASSALDARRIRNELIRYSTTPPEYITIWYEKPCKRVQQ